MGCEAQSQLSFTIYGLRFTILYFIAYCSFSVIISLRATMLI